MDYCESIQKSIDYIENNIENEIDLSKVSEESYMSLSNFYKMFFMYVSYPANEYIRLRRISLAAKELKKSDWRIIDISTKYQFENADSFARSFRRITDFLPSEYRKNNHHFNFERINIMAEFLEGVMDELMQENKEPTLHQLLFKTSEKIIRGDEFSLEEKKM